MFLQRERRIELAEEEAQVRRRNENALLEQKRAELQEAAGLKDREHFRKSHLEPLLDAGLLEMTIPDKPTSSRQRYRTTESGARVLSE